MSPVLATIACQSFAAIMSDYDSDPESFLETSEDDSELETEVETDDDDDQEGQNRRGVLPWFRVLPPETDQENDEDDGQQFDQNVGPREMTNINSKPVVYFFLMMTLDFMRQIVTETNR